MSRLMTRVIVPGAIVALFGAIAVQAQDEPAAQPTLPTTGDGGAIVKLLTNVCKPVVEGRGAFEALATSAGMTKDKNSENYILPLSQRPYQISMHKPSNQNLSICEMNVVYAPGWDQPIIDALNTWRFLHSPQMHLQRSQIATFKDAKRTTLTWDNWENQGDDGVMVSVAFNKVANTDGSQIVRGADSALIQYQQRGALPEMIAATRARKAAEAKAQEEYAKQKADYDRQMAEYQAQVKAAQDAAAAQNAAAAAVQGAAAAPDPLAAQYQAALQNAQGAAAAPK